MFDGEKFVIVGDFAEGLEALGLLKGLPGIRLQKMLVHMRIIALCEKLCGFCVKKCWSGEGCLVCKGR